MRSTLTAALLFTLAACTAAAPELATAKIDTLASGIVRVQNSGPTRWADTNGWRLVQERIIAPKEGTPGELTDFGAMVIDPAGNLYVMQRSPAMIKVYDTTGNWLRDIGREGDGPGEFRYSMLGIRADTLVVQDQQNSRLSLFTTEGRFIGAVPSQCCINIGSLLITPEGLAAIPGLSPDPEKGLMAWYLTDLRGIVHDTIIERERSSERPGVWSVELRNAASKTSLNIGIPIPAFPAERYANGPLPITVSGNTATYALAIRHFRGDTLRIFTSRAPVVSISEGRRDSMFNHAIAEMGPRFREGLLRVAKKSDVPGTWPLWNEVDIDGANRIWVARPNPSGDGHLLDVFSAEGVLLGTVPEPNHPILHGGPWTANRVYVRDEDAEGMPRILVYHIDKGEPH